MSLLVQKEKKFILTLDEGYGKSYTLNVSHYDFYNDPLLRQFVQIQKCLYCGLETKFKEEKN